LKEWVNHELRPITPQSICGAWQKVLFIDLIYPMDARSQNEIDKMSDQI
jgi:hypothetical protein